MKKILLLIFLISSLVLFANGSNNPNDNIYNDIDYWYGVGIIDRLPPIRPYSTQFIISLLNRVKNSGTKSDVIKAEKYLLEYVGNSLEKRIISYNYFNFDDPKTISGIGLEGNINPHDLIYGNIDVNMYLLNRTDDNYFPDYTANNLDYNQDDSNFDVGDITIDIFQGLNIVSSVGTDSMWFQSGLMRSSFGPLFTDSVVLNPNSPQTTHYSYTWLHDNFTFSYLLLPILASDNNGDDIRDNKYLSIRSYDFYPTSWWNFQFYESVTYGGSGLKPEYLLPFGQFFYSAGLSDTLDVNSMMGISNTIKFPQNIHFKSTVYVDDINFNELLKLNFDVKMKLAAQGNLEWYLNKNLLKTVSVGYTAILPYMYTHIDYEDNSDREDTDTAIYEFNYQNYTHMGQSLGPYNMDPNSDKVNLSISGKLPYKLNYNFSMNYIRHGNATEEDSDSSINYPTDGSIFDPGFSTEGRYMYNNSNAFLTQDILEEVFTTTLKLTTDDIPFSFGLINFGLGYTFSYTQNKDLEDGTDLIENLISLSFEYKL